MADSRANESPAVLSRAEVLIDSKRKALTAYTIQGNNYFMLRELGEHLQFPVLWRPSDQSIHIFTAPNLEVEQHSDLSVLRGTDDYGYGNYRSPTRRYLFESGSSMWILEEPIQSAQDDWMIKDNDHLYVYARDCKFRIARLR